MRVLSFYIVLKLLRNVEINTQVKPVARTTFGAHNVQGFGKTDVCVYLDIYALGNKHIYCSRTL